MDIQIHEGDSEDAMPNAPIAEAGQIKMVCACGSCNLLLGYWARYFRRVGQYAHGVRASTHAKLSLAVDDPDGQL
jgi:hypothetical protein